MLFWWLLDLLLCCYKAVSCLTFPLSVCNWLMLKTKLLNNHNAKDRCAAISLLVIMSVEKDWTITETTDFLWQSAAKKKKKDWTKTFLNPCCTSYSAFLVPMTNLVIQVFFSSSEIKIAASKMILKTSLLNISINLHVICRNKVSMRRSIKAIPRKNVIEHFEKQVEISRLKKSGFAQKGM